MLALLLAALAPAPPAAGGPAPDPGANAPSATDTATTPAPSAVPLRGRVREAGTRRPLEGVTVLVFPAPGADIGKASPPAPGLRPRWVRRATTDDTGAFTIDDVEPGSVHVAVLVDGHERHDEVLRLEPASPRKKPWAFFLRPAADGGYRTVVRTKIDEEDGPVARGLTLEELTNLPGTQGDPLRALQNLPGIARAPMGLGLLSVRGANPGDTVAYLDGHALPRPFHLGGLAAVYEAGMLESVRYIPGNFDARYGDAVGGIVELTPRTPRRDGHHGYGNLDLVSAGARVEGPVGKGTYTIGARRGYADLVLNLLPEDIDLAYRMSPRYYDYQTQLDYPVGGGTLTARVFGAGDDFRVLPGQTVVFDFEMRNQFHRADLVYRRRHGPWSFLITPSLLVERAVNEGASVADGERTDVVFSGRAEISRRLTRRTRVTLGTEAVAGRYWARGELGFEDEAPYSRTSLYTLADIGLGRRVQFVPSARFTVYTGQATRTAADPRARINWSVTDRTRLFAAAGIHSQVRPIEAERSFNPFAGGRISGALRALLPSISLTPIPLGPGDQVLFNPRRSTHTSAGVEHRFGGKVSAQVTGFYRSVWCRGRDPIAPPCERAYGAEFIVRKPLTRRFYGWLSYTLMRSELIFDTGAIPGNFDQRHIFAAVGVYRLPRNWQIGGRWRLASGTPYTPVTTGLYDASDNLYFNENGPPNGARFPVFHQLDIRVDRRFVLDRATVSLYFDVQNVYNRENVEGWVYGYDFRAKVPMTWLPILPSLGLRVDF